MKTTHPIYLALLQLFAVSSAFCASSAGIIQFPVPGRPVVVAPGESLKVGLREEGVVQLEAGAKTYPLDLALAEPVGAVRQGDAPLPDGLPPGTYDLICNSKSGKEIASGVVHVLAETPSEYAIALIRGGALPSEESDPEVVAAALRDLILPSGASLAFLMGPLREENTNENYQVLRDALAILRLPVYLCPAESDLKSPRYNTLFGSPLYPMTYGPDGYLMLGPGLQSTSHLEPGALGAAYLARRSIRHCRWSTGVTARFKLDWALRGQIALFVDDPLDYLAAAAVPAEVGNSVPWGDVQFLPPPSIPRGTLLILDVDNSGIRMRQGSE